jgi:hypothetical protein
MTKGRTLLFSVRGFDVYENSIYLVKHKPDPTAPTGLQRIGATKYPGEGIGEQFGFPIVEIGSTGRTVYLTGFTQDSPLYSKMPEAEAKQHLKRAQALLKSYRSYVSDSTAFDVTQNEDSLSAPNFQVKNDQILHTSDPENAMNLYVSLLSGRLCPKDRVGHPEFMDASYVVVDASSSRKDSEEVAVTSFQALSVFSELMKDNKEKLIDILFYMDINMADNAPDEAYQAVFMNKVFNDKNKVNEFIERVEEAEREKGHLKMIVYRKLNKIKGKSNELTKEPRKNYYYKGIDIGPDLRSAAMNISTKKELEEVLESLTEVEQTQEAE